MKRNQPSSNFLLSSSKPGAWALVGSPKVSNNLNLQFSSKSIGILVYGASITESDFQIRIRVCDYLQSTMTMIDNAELKQPNVIKLCEKQVIGVARSTSGSSSEIRFPRNQKILRNSAILFKGKILMVIKV